MFNKVNLFMTNIRNLGQGIFAPSVLSSGSQQDEESLEALSDTNKENELNNSFQSEDVQNQSLLSYMEHANNKSAIGENNLKLNIVANVILVLANAVLFYLDWYVH